MSDSEVSSQHRGYNLRDVADADPSRLRSGLVFRSSQVFDLKALHDLSIVAELDLRHSSMRDKHRAKRGHDPIPVFDTASPRDQLAHIGSRLRSSSQTQPKLSAGRNGLSEFGIRTFKIAFLQPRAQLQLLRMAPRSARWRVLRAALTCGSPQKVFGPVVADPRYIGFGKLYCLILDTAKPYIAHALKIMSHTGNLPLIIHCTHGKDRTGLLVALLLLILGVNEDDIVHDFSSSSAYLKVKRDEMTAGGYLDEDSMSDEAISSSKDIMRQLLSHIHQRYGGIHEYVKELGLRSGKVHDIRKLILRPEALAALEDSERQNASPLGV